MRIVTDFVRTDVELIRMVESDPDSTQLERELAKRLGLILDSFVKDEIELRDYHNKLSTNLVKTTQVLSAC